MASASTPTPTGNGRIIRRSPEEVTSERNVGLIDEICTEDILDHSLLGEVRGRDGLRAQILRLKGSLNDFSAAVENTVTEGDTVIMHVTLHETHDDAFMGIEPTGKSIEIGDMAFTRIEDGIIAERWVQLDMLGMLTQLGAVRPPTA